jgi:hypothetical protein
MQTTNKRIAFYTAIIGTILSIVLPALGLDIAPEQQETLVVAMLMICAAFGVGDIGFDWINASRGNFDVTVTETKTVTPVTPATPVTTETTTTISAPVFTENPDNVSVAG